MQQFKSSRSRSSKQAETVTGGSSKTIMRHCTLSKSKVNNNIIIWLIILCCNCTTMVLLVINCQVSDEEKSFKRASTNRSVNKNTCRSLCPRSICNVPHSSLSLHLRNAPLLHLALYFQPVAQASFPPSPRCVTPALHQPSLCLPPQTFQQNTLKDRGQNRRRCNWKCIFGTSSELSADIERLQIWVGPQFI